MNDDRNMSRAADVDEESMGELLRLAGARPPMPDARLARVQEGVHRHWRNVSRRRTLRRRVVAVAAILAAAAIVFFVMRVRTRDWFSPASEAVVAVVNQIDGSVPGLALDGRVAASRWIETAADGRVGLRLIDGTSLRLDAGSRARLVSERLVELTRGALYVDSPGDRSGLEVRTPTATARDIGTQFEVRLTGDEVRVSVRSGSVELRDERRSAVARAGTEVALSVGGVVERRIAIHGPQWDWTAQVAPRVRFAGRALSSVLEEIVRERGWRLRYSDPQLAIEASGFVLHGSLEGLSAVDALEVATATSAVGHRLEDGELVIFRRTATR
jgi:ferric-dicitrate binding protein FerR (iron transport regulator)